MATRHVIELGHRNIAYIGGPSGSRISKEKQRGFEKALADAGLSLRPECFFEGRYRFETGFNATTEFLRLPSPPTAIVAANDVIAIGCMKYLLMKGKKVPEEMAVIGLDDQPLAATYEPSISTVSIPIADMCAEAVRMLMRRIEKPNARSHKVVMKTELKVRRSTDANSNLLADFR